ncbi:MAG: 6-pyruvoyl tetrahydropterin synthase family protein [Candidatus Thermoplasmatota archaeon]|jgi:6-pyruvoyltetrahydropterin/6-carboxytetrahydropterin synthase|nr:6-pyruvoyl tetrahydropterin synthase family protein [Candidatus Thermoplasmatota archaeon]
MQLEVDGWKTDIRFSAAHFIPSHTKCSRLHGHDYFVRAKIFGETEGEFVVDYLEVIQQLKFITARMDHRLLVPTKSDISRYTITGDTCIISYGEKEIRVSRNDIFELPATSSASEEISRYVAEELRDQLSGNKNIEKIMVCVDEGPGMGACYEIRFTRQ